MMKKLIVLLLCLSLTFCATFAGADAPVGWHVHTTPSIGLKAWLPADFIILGSSTPQDVRALASEFTYGYPGALCAYSQERSSILLILPAEEDYEILDEYMFSLFWLFKPIFMSGMDFPVEDVTVRKVPDKKHRYICTTFKFEENTEHLYCMYTPQFEGAHFQLAYVSTDSKITSAEYDMLDTVLMNLVYTGR